LASKIPYTIVEILEWLEAMSLREEKPAATPLAIGVVPCRTAAAFSPQRV
jgi:hypothetical protein